MGEIADSMLGGEMCAGCGQWLECMLQEKVKHPCSEMGIPVYCSEACAKEYGIPDAYTCPH